MSWTSDYNRWQAGEGPHPGDRPGYTQDEDGNYYPIPGSGGGGKTIDGRNVSDEEWEQAMEWQRQQGRGNQPPPNMSGYYNEAAAMSLRGTMAGIAAQERMLRASLAQQAEFYYQTRQDMMPWLEAGGWALEELQGFLKEGTTYFPTPEVGEGEGATAREQVPSWAKDVYQNNVYEESPHYNFLQQEGTKALDRSAASRGMLLSGPQVKESQRFGQQLASTDIDNWLRQYYDKANLSGGQFINKIAPYQAMSGLGQLTGSQLGATGAQYANLGTSAMMQAGTNTANMLQSGYNTAAGLRASGAASDAMNQWQYQQNQLTAQRERDMWNQYNRQRQGDDGPNWAGGFSGGVSGAFAGAAVGAKIGSIGGPWGAVIGGAGGFLAGLFS